MCKHLEFAHAHESNQHASFARVASSLALVCTGLIAPIPFSPHDTSGQILVCPCVQVVGGRGRWGRPRLDRRHYWDVS